MALAAVVPSYIDQSMMPSTLQMIWNMFVCVCVSEWVVFESVCVSKCMCVCMGPLMCMVLGFCGLGKQTNIQTSTVPG